MEEKKVMSHQIKGLLISLIVIVLGLIGYFTKMSEKSGFNWISNIVLFVGIVWGCVYFANQKEGYVTFGNVFAHGFKMSVVIALILVVYTLISIYLIFPDMKEKALEMARQRMEERGKMSDSDIENAMNITKKFFTPFLIGGILLGTLIIGALASLLGAAMAKKKPGNPLEQLDRLDQSR